MTVIDGPDRAAVLTGLVERGKARKLATRLRQANDQTTDRFLAAGIRLLAHTMGLDSEAAVDQTFKEWLSINKVVTEAQRDGPLQGAEDKLPSKGMLTDRWPAHDDYIGDLIAYILALHHWDWQQDILAQSGELLTDGGDLVSAIQIVCYSDLKTLINDPAQRILPLLTILVSKDQPSRELCAQHYWQVRDRWAALFEATFALYNIRLRPGIEVQEAADILTALADGLAMRATGDPEAKVIDKSPGDSLLGRAATMLLLAAIDPGDQLRLEDALRRMIATDTTEPG